MYKLNSFIKNKMHMYKNICNKNKIHGLSDGAEILQKDVSHCPAFVKCGTNFNMK